MIKIKKISFSIIAVLLICCPLSAKSQSLTGKWICTNRYIWELKLSNFYQEMKGECDFSENGKFQIKVWGEMREEFENYDSYGHRLNARSHSTTSFRLKVSGKYQIYDRKITTTVKPRKVRCSASTSWPTPSPMLPENETYFTEEKTRISDRPYRDYVNRSNANYSYNLSQHIKKNCLHLWKWEELPVEIVNDTLKIGGRPWFVRE